ncbi:hypothetical protein L5515_007529 [Caenorhabditis briggsae]|uniref:Uncharacterized protein n=1 Tax=Caenorhabditis briggsae TaxID=6238 RepID=A0AAE9EYQ5_CAEBR|nr:hypothetical protein L3Y34_007690 [Caenorhabditis briggsae]UMM34455.1 hypothetical protein L5515_007529 [Caenorhabditis briggsae]
MIATHFLPLFLLITINFVLVQGQFYGGGPMFYGGYPPMAYGPGYGYGGYGGYGSYGGYGPMGYGSAYSFYGK